jgi:hypothetical protein
MRSSRIGLGIVLLSAVLGLLAAVVLIVAPLSILTEPAFEAGNVPSALRAWALPGSC